jgi:hypothetical protein
MEGMMRKLVVCAALSALISVPASAAADPLRVTVGQFNIDHEGDRYLFGGSGFEVKLSFDPQNPDLNYGLWVEKVWNAGTCFVPMQDETCVLGESIDVSFATPGETNMGIGDATINGTSYERVAIRGTLDFDVAPIPMTTSIEEDFNAIRSPFVFSGLIRGLSNGTEVFSLSVAGSGRIFTPLYREGDRFFGEDGKVVYEFEDVAATPEPASVLLLLSGLAGIVARQRRASS